MLHRHWVFCLGHPWTSQAKYMGLHSIYIYIYISQILTIYDLGNPSLATLEAKKCWSTRGQCCCWSWDCNPGALGTWYRPVLGTRLTFWSSESCDKNLGLSENRVYSQWNSHLIGIMISKTIGCRGTTIFRHTHLLQDDDAWNILKAMEKQKSSSLRVWKAGRPPVLRLASLC